MFAAAFEKHPCRNASKINSSSEEAIKIHFQYRSCNCDEFFEFLGTCVGVQFIVNLHVTLFNFKPLVRKSYIESQH